MDPAVALVQAYLQINGYFTVTEYGIVESIGGGASYRSSTDLDVLAVHFPGAGHRLVHRGRPPAGELAIAADDALGTPPDRLDMIIGEVKEGRAELNRGARKPRVLEAVLTRFGCCPPQQAPSVVRDLLQHGEADLPPPHSHRARLVAFGTHTSEPLGYACRVVSLQHVIASIDAYVHENWDILRHAPSKDTALSLLMLLEKVRAAAPTDA